MQVYYFGQLIKVVFVAGWRHALRSEWPFIIIIIIIKVVNYITYLGLNFTGNRNCSPSVEHLIVAAERTRFAVQNRLRNISCLAIY